MTSPLATCYCCGYHLGTLPDTERCPECGASAEYARRTLTERFPRPQHIREAYGWSVALLVTLAAAPTVGPVIFVFAIALMQNEDYVLSVTMAVGAFLGVAWSVSWAFLAAFDPSVDLRRSRPTRSNLAVIAIGAAVSALTIFLAVVNTERIIDSALDGGALASVLALLALAQLFFGARIATRLIALCHRRPRRVWLGLLLQIGVGLLALVVMALTILRAMDEMSSGVGSYPVTAPATIAIYLVPAVIILTVLIIGRLCGALLHASRRYKAHLTHLRARALAPDPAP